MLSFIKEVEESTTFQIPVFDGKIIFEVRTLSPIEAEAAGLSSSMIGSSMLGAKQVKKIITQKEKIGKIDLENPSDEDLEILLNIMDGFQPEQLLSIEEQQNRILCTVVKRASEDKGKTFEKIHLVKGFDQQDAKQNRLWVGMLTKEDRSTILEKALNSHKVAVERLNMFRSTG